MRAHRAVTALFALLLLSPTTARAADLALERSKVTAAEARVTRLQQQLDSLLTELRTLESEVATASGGLGVSYLRLHSAEGRAERARALFSARARDAYKLAGWREAHVLLGVRTFTQMLSFSRYLGGALSADAAAYRELLRSRDAIVEERLAIDEQKRRLLASTARLDELRSSIASTLQLEQEGLARARAVLSALETQRRRSLGRVSPAVEARRAARQIVLDQRLAALLSWYAPAAGAEPFMPRRLRTTGIATSGLSSWYGPGFDGRRASSGATYRQDQYTAASLLLPFGTLLKVSMGSRAAVVVITDRGPYVPGRVLDLSAAAAQAIGLSGVKTVRMEIVVPREPAPPFP